MACVKVEVVEIVGKTLSERIKSARDQSGKTQQAVADGAGMGMRTYQDIEYGVTKTPSYVMVAAIARVFEVSFEQLTGLPTAPIAKKPEAPKEISRGPAFAPAREILDLAETIPIDILRALSDATDHAPVRAALRIKAPVATVSSKSSGGKRR